MREVDTDPPASPPMSRRDTIESTIARHRADHHALDGRVKVLEARDAEREARRSRWTRVIAWGAGIFFGTLLALIAGALWSLAGRVRIVPPP